MRNYVLIVLLLVSQILFSQLFQTEKDDRLLIEKTVNDYTKYKDNLSLEEKEKKLLLTDYNSHDFAIIKSVFAIMKANNQLNSDDGLNTISDTYFREAINTGTKLNSVPLIIYGNLQYGAYLYRYRQMSKALPSYLRNINLIEKTNVNSIVFPCETYKLIGFYFGTLGDTNTSIKFLKLAEKETQNDHKELAAIQDNIGYFYILDKKYKQAIPYFKSAEKLALNVKDFERYAKVLGNIGIYHMLIGDYKSATNYLQRDLKISEKLQSDKNTMFALTNLAKAYMLSNQNDLAALYTSKAEVYAASKPYYKNNELNITEIQLELAKRNNDDAKELTYRRKLDELSTELLNTDGPNAISKTNWSSQMQKFNDNLKLQQEKSKSDRITFNASIIVLLLVIIVLFLLYSIKNKKVNIEKQEQQQHIDNLQLEISLAEEKLNNSNQSLTSYREVLSRKNSQIQSLTKQVDLQLKNSPNNNEETLNKVLQSHLMTEENWLNFKKIFIKEQPDYFHHLKQNFPDLTDANLRLLMLMKLGLTSREISNTLGITTDAIKKAKQRLRKKYEHNYEELL